MLKRWLSAIIGMPIFVGFCFWGPVPFALGILGLSGVALFEMVKTYRSVEIRINPVFAGVGLLGAVAPVSGQQTADHVYAAGVIVTLLALVWEVVRAASEEPIQTGQSAGHGLLCGLYVSLFGGLSALRADVSPVQDGLFRGQHAGLPLVILVACCVWATDSAALFAGHRFGKQKLAPRLSPGKTVEGAVGGLIAGVFIGALFGWWFIRDLPLGLAIGGAAGLFGQIGDLFESALKREADVKDFGNIFPGHGGVLDRFDSLLFVGPLVWLLLSIIHR